MSVSVAAHGVVQGLRVEGGPHLAPLAAGDGVVGADRQAAQLSGRHHLGRGRHGLRAAAVPVAVGRADPQEPPRIHRHRRIGRRVRPRDHHPLVPPGQTLPPPHLRAVHHSVGIGQHRGDRHAGAGPLRRQRHRTVLIRIGHGHRHSQRRVRGHRPRTRQQRHHIGVVGAVGDAVNRRFEVRRLREDRRRHPNQVKPQHARRVVDAEMRGVAAAQRPHNGVAVLRRRRRERRHPRPAVLRERHRLRPGNRLKLDDIPHHHQHIRSDIADPVAHLHRHLICAVAVAVVRLLEILGRAESELPRLAQHQQSRVPRRPPWSKSNQPQACRCRSRRGWRPQSCPHPP